VNNRLVHDFLLGVEPKGEQPLVRLVEQAGEVVESALPEAVDVDDDRQLEPLPVIAHVHLVGHRLVSTRNAFGIERCGCN